MEADLDFEGNQALQALKSSLEYWQIRHSLKEEIIKPKYKAEDLPTAIPKLMERLGLGTTLKNILHEHFERNRIGAPNPVSQAVSGLGGTGGVGGGGGSISPQASSTSLHSQVSSSAPLGQTPLSPSSSAHTLSGMAGDLAVLRKQEESRAAQAVLLPPGLVELRSQWQRVCVEKLAMLSTAGKRLPAQTRKPTWGNLEPHPSTRRDLDEQSEALPADRRVFVYSIPDLLASLTSLRSLASAQCDALQTLQQSSGDAVAPRWGSVQATLKTPSVDWLRKFFHELTPMNRQVGLDDLLHKWFAVERLQAGQAFAQEGSILHCRTFARSGVPAGVRTAIWMHALGVRKVSEKNKQYYERLTDDVKAREMFSDFLIKSDVARISDDPSFFIFEDQLQAMLLAFSRDTEIGPACAVPPHPTLVGIGRGGQEQGPYPPCGVLPFKGLACYACMLCYLSPHPAESYSLFRALYIRHFCRLHVLHVAATDSLSGPSFPAICATFEAVLQELEPALMFHLLELEVTPLDFACPWIVQAFVGFLEPEQVLLLWDRIIGFDSLLILPLLAAAVFSFRRDDLLSSCNKIDVEEVLEDITQLKVVPLLQQMLFVR